MRVDREYIELCNKYRQEDGSVIFPIEVEKRLQYRNYLRNSIRELEYRAENNCFTKGNWEMIQKAMAINDDPDVPEDIWVSVLLFKEFCQELYEDFTTKKNEYFINEYTLTRAGRKRIREGLRQKRLVC